MIQAPNLGICAGLFCPAYNLISAIDRRSGSSGLNIGNLYRVVVSVGIAIIILADKLRVTFIGLVIVAKIKTVVNIQNCEINLSVMFFIWLRQCVERQQGQCHYKHQNPRQQPLSCFLSSHKKIPPSFGRNTAHRRGSMNASATGCHAVRGHRLGSWLCDTGFRRLCLLSAHLLVSVSRTAYD